MKLLMVWHAGGVRSYFERYTHLAEQYEEVKVIVPDKWNEGGKLVGINNAIKLADNCLIVPVKIYFKKQAIFLFNQEQLEKHIDEFQPDVVHIHEEPWSFCTFQVLKACRKIHNKNKKIILDSAAINYEKKFFPFSYIEKMTYQSSDLIFARNDEVVDVLKNRGYKGKIKILGNGVDTSIFKQNGTFIDKQQIIFVGRLIESKGVFVLLEAFEKLTKNNKNEKIKLFFLGSGESENELKKLVSEQGLSDRVNFHERVESQEVAKFISESRVLVLPSISTKKWKEQFGRVLVECLVLGRPVLGSTCGEIPNVVNNEKYVFNENDVDDLYEHLMYVISPENNDMIEKDTKKMRNSVIDRYDWENLALYHKEVIDDLISKD